jgi:hypothetical protein
MAFSPSNSTVRPRARTRALEPVLEPVVLEPVMSQNLIIEEARKAGFVLEARSEINANPKDTKAILSVFGGCPRRVAARQRGSKQNRTLTAQDTMRSASRPNDSQVSKTRLRLDPMRPAD